MADQVQDNVKFRLLGDNGYLTTDGGVVTVTENADLAQEFSLIPVNGYTGSMTIKLGHKYILHALVDSIDMSVSPVEHQRAQSEYTQDEIKSDKHYIRLSVPRYDYMNVYLVPEGMNPYDARAAFETKVTVDKRYALYYLHPLRGLNGVVTALTTIGKQVLQQDDPVAFWQIVLV